MDDFSNSTSLIKEQQEKEVKPVDDDIEAGFSGTIESATELESEKEAAETADEEISRKRTGKPSTTDPKKKKLEQNQDLDNEAPSKSEEEKSSKKEQEQSSKKKKIERKSQDVAFPTPFNGEGKASEKKEEQEQKQHLFNVPKTPPATSKATVPATPMGKPPQEMNPKYTPSRPKGTSRLLKW